MLWRQQTVPIALDRFVSELLELSVRSKFFHWNIKGQRFFPLHEKFDEFHSDLIHYADEIAERYRALDKPVGLDFEVKYSARTPDVGKALDHIVDEIKELTTKLDIAIVNDETDPVTQDVLIEVKRGLDKWRWMFASAR
jgi:starvation-inducible DNA-binding protein